MRKLSIIEVADLIQEEDMAVTLTHFGYIKRVTADTYRAQKRGGKGITGMTTREEDYAEQIFVTSTHAELLFFTTRGRMFKLTCYEIPEAGRTAKGTAIVNLLQLDGGEKVTTVIPVDENQGGNLVMATKNGVIKKTALSEFSNMRASGLIAVTLREDDELIGVALTDGTRELLLGTRQGMSIRFHEDNIRLMGRSAMGVKSMELDPGDEIVSMSVVHEGTQVLTVSENGYGKRTPVEEYRVQSRGGKGIKAMQLTDKTGLLAALMLVREEEDVMMISDDGTIIRTAVADISTQSRSTQGVRMMRLAGDSRVVAVTATEKVEETPEAEAIEQAHAQASEALAEGAVPADEALAEDLGYQGDEEADIARLLHDSLATGLSQFQHFGGTGCRSGIARQAHADAFTHQSHGVCCAHHPTGAAARAGAADQFVQLLFRNLSIEIACTGRGDVDKVHIFTVQNGGLHVAACENDTGNIHAAGGHQHGRDNFVAGSDEHGTI